MPEVQTKILVKDNKGNFRFVAIPAAPKPIFQKPRPAVEPPAVAVSPAPAIKVKEEPKKVVKIEQALQEVEPKPVFVPKVPSFAPRPTFAKAASFAPPAGGATKAEPAGRPAPSLKSTSVLEFDAEDEEELRKIKAKTAALVGKEESDQQRIVKEIVVELNLSFPDPILKNRFEKIISAGLKELRSPIETKETLLRPVKIGGMGYGRTEVEKIAGVLEKYLKPFQAKKISLPKVVKKEVLTPKPPAVVSRPRVEIPRPIPPAPAPRPIPVSPSPVRPVSQLPQIKRPEAALRPKVADIKKPSRLVGPLDELRLLNLIDFRRLGESSTEIMARLQEKIDSLAEESFAKRTAGMKAWRESEVYRLYLEIGNESIAKNKPIKEIVRERQAASRPTLTEAEFAGILDLNKKLRF